jgi:hypothetical protein
MELVDFVAPCSSLRWSPEKAGLREAEMTTQHTESQVGRPIVVPAIAGLVFATLFCKLDGAAAQVCRCHAFWAALEVLRLAVLLAKWHPLAAYLYENSRFVQHLLQLGASLWPWLSVIAG